MFGYVTFNVKYYILSQIFYKKIGWHFVSSGRNLVINHVGCFWFIVVLFPNSERLKHLNKNEFHFYTVQDYQDKEP